MGSAVESKVTKLLRDRELFREACYIDGRWVAGDPGRTIQVDDPATGEIIGAVPRLGRAETRQAIDAAAAALPEWRARTAKERSVVLRRWFELIMGRLYYAEQVR